MIEQQCVYDIISFVERNYNQQLAIKDIEAVSFYSYRNIQRIFKFTCGETIGAFQKRLRLERAYKMLIFTSESITHIALEVGFDNSASFSKAFTQQYDMSPKDTRGKKDILFAENGISPKFADNSIKPEMVFLPTTKVYYQGINTDYNNDDIEVLWDKLMSHSFPNQGVTYYGVIADEPLITDKIKCRYDACTSILPYDFTLPEKQIFGGRYAKFIHYGSYDKIDETYTKIYAGWMLTQKLAMGVSPIIEQYIMFDDNSESEDQYITAIYIPLF